MCRQGKLVRIPGLLDFIHPLEFSMLENMFQKLDQFPSSGQERGDSYSVGPLQRANLSHWPWQIILAQYIKSKLSNMEKYESHYTLLKATEYICLLKHAEAFYACL
jgi:hypothetical protein